MVKMVLKIRCSDKPGIVATISQYIFERGGNILNLDQHTDERSDTFFCRIEWVEEQEVDKEGMREAIKKLMIDNGLCLTYGLYFREEKPRMAIFVSKYDHCLYDLLFRWRSKELVCEIPVIISNHEDLRYVAENFGIPFEYIPVKGRKEEAEKEQMALLEKYDVHFVVLARYMQILSQDFISKYPNRIINIHHSFLPAFKGAKPYHQAFERGVKMVGATAHFVTEVLDQGPIIAQGIIPISHQDRVNDLVMRGRDVERQVLSRAVKAFADYRIFMCEKKTIILGGFH